MPDTVLLQRPPVRTPLDALKPISTPGRLVVTPAPARARLVLRGNVAALGTAFGLVLPVTPCRAVLDGDRAALWLGPDEWLLLAPSLEAVDVPDAAVVDVSHRQVGLVVEGAGAANLLSAGNPLDLHPSAFPPGMCTRTVFGKAEIILWRTDADRFHVEVWRSFAAYVHEYLSTAARSA